MATTVRQAPEQAIEAPSAISEVSNAVAIVKSTRSPRRNRFTRPRSVMMPVNIALGYGSATSFTRGSLRHLECDGAAFVRQRGTKEAEVMTRAAGGILLTILLT